jgi:hypothetical protein
MLVYVVDCIRQCGVLCMPIFKCVNVQKQQLNLVRSNVS